MLRLRIQRTNWDRPALILTDIPRPNCRTCAGYGGIEHEYIHPETGEYDGCDWEPCGCWNEDRWWILLRLPRRRRTTRAPWATTGYSNEPPF